MSAIHNNLLDACRNNDIEQVSELIQTLQQTPNKAYASAGRGKYKCVRQ